MLGPMYLALITAMFFYLMLPVSGGIITRTRWKMFRTRIMSARALPRLGFDSHVEPDAEFRFFGEVDAIGGRNELWLRNEGLSCVINARAAALYLLIGDGTYDEEGGNLERVRWAALSAIPQVARAYAIGRAVLEGGRMVLSPSDGKPVILVIHNGRDEDVEPRIIWNGRQQNEYWNPLTQVSLVVGLLAMSLIVSRVLASRTLPSISAITLAAGFSPLLPLLPPGVIGFILYRSSWRKARFCRSRRDLAAFEGGDSQLLQSWARKSVATTILSGVYLAAALAVNFALVVLLLRRIL